MSTAVQGLYAIVDVPHPFGLSVAEMTRAVLGDRLEGGADGASVVQLRAKDASTEQRVQWLQQMAPLCRDANAMLVVNDDFEAALAVNADGLHLGQGDPGADDLSALRRDAQRRGHANLQIGLSTHDLGQLRAAGKLAPDYLALGPIAPTRSKKNPDPIVGMPQLLDACRIASRPLVAIGGLGQRSGAQAIEMGAAAVALIGALVFDSADRTRTEAISMSRAFRNAAAWLDLDEVHRQIPVLEREQLAELARWGDNLGVHVGLGLPARFGPRIEDGAPQYRPCDVIDLVHALGKHPGESWSEWSSRGAEEAGPLVQLRRE
ncbi:MAG: thiamine phosphate synthase [Myxococcota bacterium]